MDRKKLADQYKNRLQTGGVFAIHNTVSDRWYIDSTADLKAAENRFEFMPDSFLAIAKDYRAQGDGFVFEVLDELKQDGQNTAEQFRKDLDALKSLWLEKMASHKLY